MKRIFKIILFTILFLLMIVAAFVVYSWFSHEPNWHIEENAVRTESHPYAGFWKDENCDDGFGWAIGPAGDDLYYISFCGPGGCFAEDSYRSNTTIINDPKYNVTDENTIDFWSSSGWSTHVRCTGRVKKATDMPR